MTIWRLARRSSASCVRSTSNAGRTGRRRAAALLGILILFLAATPPAAGQGSLSGGRVSIGGTPRGRAMLFASMLARRLAKKVKKVQKRFAKRSKVLAATEGPGGEPVYSREQVMNLIDVTEKDLDQAIESAGDKELAAMRDWVEAKFQRIRAELGAAAGSQAAALSKNPRPVAMVASLGPPSLQGADSARADASSQGTKATEPGKNRWLQDIEEVLAKIFLVAKKEQLAIKLEVRSTPEQAQLEIFTRTRQHRGRKIGKFYSTITPATMKGGPIYRGLYMYCVTKDGYQTATCPEDLGDLADPSDFGNRPCPGKLVGLKDDSFLSFPCELDLMQSDGPITCQLETSGRSERPCSLPQGEGHGS